MPKSIRSLTSPGRQAVELSFPPEIHDPLGLVTGRSWDLGGLILLAAEVTPYHAPLPRTYRRGDRPVMGPWGACIAGS